MQVWRVGRMAVASVLWCVVVTVGLGWSTHGRAAAPGGSMVQPSEVGAEPAILAVRPEGPAEALQGRAAKPHPPLGTAVLVTLACTAAGLGFWSSRHMDVAARLRILFDGAPQRAPPSSRSLVLS